MSFTHLTTKNGLSSNTVYDLIQDRQGFIWFATRNGLDRYDGYHITEYKYNSLDSCSIGANWCQSLYVDREGKLWIGALYGGLNLYDSATDKFIVFKHDPENPHSISSNVVLAICEDDSGNLWLGTWIGLNKLARKYVANPDPATAKFFRYNHDPDNPNSLSDDRIWTLFYDSRGIIWIGSEWGGLTKFNPKTNQFKNYRHDPQNSFSISNNSVRCICEDIYLPQRTLWVGTRDGGLNKFEMDTEQFFSEGIKEVPGKWGKHTILAVKRDASGNLWIGTFGGLKKYSLRTDENFFQNCFWYHANRSDPASLCSNAIKTLYTDNSGNFWVGTLGGVNLAQKPKIKFQNCKVPGPMTITRSNDSTLWVGTGGGLYEIGQSGTSMQRYDNDLIESTRLCNNDVCGICEEPNCTNRTLWLLCRDGGLDKMIIKKDSASGQEEVRVQHILPNPADSLSIACTWGLDMIRDHNGNLWIGANDGLFQYNPAKNKVMLFHANPDDPRTAINDRIDRIYQSPFENENVLWLGSNNGLYRVDLQQKNVMHFKPNPKDPNSLNSTRVISICADEPTRGKIMWVGTFSGGLNKLDLATNIFKQFTENEGLPSNTIYSILQDRNGMLWLGTDNGLVKFNPETGTSNTYNTDDGYSFTSFYLGASFKCAKTGKMYLGGDHGLIAFYPDSIKSHAAIPKIVLTDFKVFNKSFRLDTSITQIRQINLHYRQNFFSFEFAALDYLNPEKQHYAYQLEGVDEEWVYCGNRRLASYTNIGGGKYVFKVKGSNSEGIWNETGTSVKIVITPPFWETGWFRTLLVLLFPGILGLIYKIRVTMLVRQRNAQQAFSNKLIEAVEAGRKRIARELHDSLGQNLLIIKNEIQMLRQSEFDNDPAARGDLDELSTLISESIDEVREISADLHPHLLDRLGLKTAIESLVKKVSRSTMTTISSEIGNIDHLLPSKSEIHLFRIIQEALNNIVKHSAATSAQIQITNSDHEIQIVVNDNGKGFDPKKQASNSCGFGLNGIRERAKILDAKLDVNSKPGNGTTLKMRIPVQNHFKQGT